MPYPQKGESKKEFIARFVSSDEAQSDFPDEKQRLAVAYSMFEKRNSTFSAYGKEHPWPEKYHCSFIEPGVVFYGDLGPCKVCGTEMRCGEGKCQNEGETVLVKQEALAKMAQSFVGKPVIDMMHKDVTPETVAEGEADGIVTRVWLDDKSGWWMAEFLVWNPETQLHCESPAYSVSCAYEPSEVDSNGGSYHNLDYHEEIKDGVYTHLAVVTNPRYEGARIFLNSKGGNMWKLFRKGDRKNAADLDPSKKMVTVGKEKVSLQTLLNAAAARKNADQELPDDTVLEHEGDEMTLGELKQGFLDDKKVEEEKKNAEDMCPACKGSGKKAAENAAGEAGKERIGEPAKLPDLRAEGEDAAAKKAAEDKMAAEKKNADDAAAKKAADEKAALEKKNADDAAAKVKADEEKKNAEDEAAKVKADEERRNAGREAFRTLRNAAQERNGDFVKPSIAPMQDDRLARGREKYGSAA